MGGMVDGGGTISFSQDVIAKEGRFLRKVDRYFRDVNGKFHVWEMVERISVVKGGRIIAIAAITPEKEIILNKIFRVPLWDFVLELPAGLMDIEGETEEEAIRRELLEETGYKVDEVELLLEGPFNTGIMKDKMAIFLGTNARFVQNPQLESTEDIKVIKIPVRDLAHFISQNQSQRNIDLRVSSVIPYLFAKDLF